MHITHKRNLRIDKKIGNKLMLSISTELCHKNIMLGLLNVNPLTLQFMTISKHVRWLRIR